MGLTHAATNTVTSCQRHCRITLSARRCSQHITRGVHVVRHASPADTPAQSLTAVGRRSFLMLSAVGISPPVLSGLPAFAEESAIIIESDSEGFGKHSAQAGDLVLFHYVGVLESTGQVFDSTRGGIMYRDGGMGKFRPAAVQLGSGPVPGLCRGLRQGLEGMRIGGKRTFIVPPGLGFGSTTVGAPYAVVPPNATLRYEVELIRLSARGPDELTSGIARCGTGGASGASERCEQIEPAEFV